MKIKRLCNAKKGFSLIEVIIALAILMIVVLGLLTSYYSYYRNMVDLRIQTTGQNLAQLQLEDVQNLAVSVLSNLVKDKPSNTPPEGWSTTYTIPNYPGDTDPSPFVYDSGDGSALYPLIDGSFRIEHLTNICGETTGDLPGDLLLPSSIEVIRVPATGVFDHYNIILHKEVFPSYKKQIVITDKTPGLTDAQKIFSIEVTVFWNEGGTEKSITVTGEKSYARSG